MFFKFIYSFLFVLVACLVSSCTSDNPDNVDFGEGLELSFAVSESTRASETLPFNNFAVYGDIKNPGDKNAVPVVLFNKTLVEYKDNGWQYDGTQYWFPNKEHSFVAITPLTVLETANNPRYSNSQLSFTYSIPTTDGNMEKDKVTDILAATNRTLYEGGYVLDKNSSVPVTLKFRHILSRVNFALALDDNLMKSDEFVLIRKMELSGIRTKALFNILPASRQSNHQTDDCVFDVTEYEGDAKFTIDYADPIKIPNNGTHVSLLANDDAFIMLPQAFNADSKTKIVVTYTVNGDTDAPKQLTLLFTDTRWETGNSYLYKSTFTIDKSEVQLQNMSITDWIDSPLEGEAISD